MFIYMGLWSLVMVGLLGSGRFRAWQQWVVAVVGTALILLISQTLFVQLSAVVNIPPAYGFVDPVSYVGKGAIGWMALLIMPCGWLAPLISLNIVRRWQQEVVKPGFGF